uniref:Uncharacterized protein n=1 Tax=Anopheles minimus TaxID=112268 RepID=A0A182WNZ5_9DIPT
MSKKCLVRSTLFVVKQRTEQQQRMTTYPKSAHGSWVRF